MDQIYPDLSALLAHSTDAEGFWAQLPEWIQMAAAAQGASIHTSEDLRRFAADL